MQNSSFLTKTGIPSPVTTWQRGPSCPIILNAKVIILNTRFIIFNAKSMLLKAQFVILNAKFVIFSPFFSIAFLVFLNCISPIRTRRKASLEPRFTEPLRTRLACPFAFKSSYVIQNSSF